MFNSRDKLASLGMAMQEGTFLVYIFFCLDELPLSYNTNTPT
jgi:hypothetical protein